MDELKNIKSKFDQKLSAFAAIRDYPWSNKEFYAAWLSQSFFYSRQVTRLLLSAASRFDLERGHLHKRFVDHAREEKGHEILATRDVADLGYRIEDIGEFSITRAFYQSQYFAVQSISPEALFGWILPLEGLAIAWGKEVRTLVKSQNEDRPTRFLDIHVDEDPDHVEKAMEILTSCELSRHEKAILDNMDFTVDLYFEILDGCEEWSRSGLQTKSAG